MNLQSVFEKIGQSQGAHSPWKAFRQNGFRYFELHGLPTKKDENWKYTSLRQLTEESLAPAVPPQVIRADELKLELGVYLNPDFYQLVLINGALAPELSDLKDLSKIKIVSLDLIGTTTILESIQKARKQIPDLRQDAMEALNSAFFQTGIGIEIPAETSLGRPLQILNYSDSAEATYPKILIQVGKGASVSLVETYVSGNLKSLTNSVMEAVIEESAKLECIRVQAEGSEKIHIGCSRFLLQENSSLESLSYSTGGKVFRHNLDVYCLGPSATAQVNGLTLSAKDQHHDNHTTIDHVVGNCTTTQLYKSILDDDSRAVFNGSVVIRKNAQKASSEQLNKNLLLSSKAEADSKPQLDVFADDVKATHGSTVGQLNPEELFYFLSRAIPKDKALEMLSLGFVKELIDRVSTESVRRWLSTHLKESYQAMKGNQP